MNFADLSHHNPDPINWDIYKGSRDRVILKATEHTTFEDSKFVERFKATKGLRLAYHFARCREHGETEFQHYLSVLKKAGFDKTKDWMVLDVEDRDSSGYLSKAKPNAQQFTQAAVEAGYTNGLIYSYRAYLRDTSITANDLPVGWRKLWLADYTFGQADKDIELPPGWSRDQVVARQYSDEVNVPGCTGMVDDNRVIIEWMKNPQPPPQGEDFTIMDQTTKDYLDHNFGLVLKGDPTHLNNLQNAVAKAEAAYNKANEARALAQQAVDNTNAILEILRGTPTT